MRYRPLWPKSSNARTTYGRLRLRSSAALQALQTSKTTGYAEPSYLLEGLPLDERSEMIALICEADAKQTFQVHKAHFGEPPFIIQQLGGLKKTGCLSVLIAGLIGTSIPLGLVLYEALGWS